ncbi:MAG: TerB family tellurite resistance protein [Gammaproteobacteria bacterium]|nr:TerB family tellurite resistance protein [Gammaproteobacteria bacterium]
MIQTILDFFNTNLSLKTEAVDQDHQIKLASASLLIEMIRMDHKIEQTEHDTVKALLKKDFSLSDDETDNLFMLAEEESNNAVDYYRFSKLINQSYDNSQKIRIIENLWHIAYADGELDKYEEHYLRKIADLLHLPHKEFIKAKHRVSENT